MRVDEYHLRQQKRVRIKWFKRLRLLVLIAVIYLVAAGGIKLYNSSYFNVKKITVIGNRQLSDKEVKKLSDVRVSKDSLLKISVSEIEKRLLKNSLIKSTEVSRDFPDTIRIKIVEREPIACLTFKDKLFLIDKDLFVLLAGSSADVFDLPQIKDLKLNHVQVGKRINSEILSQAIKSLTSLNPSLRADIDFVSAASVDRISFFTLDNIEILYGKAGDIERKNFVLKEILAENREKIIFIDIRQVSKPIVRYFEKSAGQE